MKKQTIIIGIILTILAAGFLFFKAGPLSIIGEEGYKAYDPMLAAGGYDQARWVFLAPNCGQTINERALACSSIKTWDGVFVRDNGLRVAGNTGPSESSPVGLRTTDLRLTNFRADFVTQANRYRDYSAIASSTLSTPQGPVYTSPSRTNWPRENIDRVSVELLWNDYALGEYVVKVNGAVRQEGIAPEGEAFYLSWTADPTWGYDYTGTNAGLENPRYQSLFACDLQEGVVRVHDCRAGPDRVSLADMPGWTGFCPLEPAIITDSGVETASKQVYYSWAADGVHVMDSRNDRIEWNYLADAQTQLGYPIGSTGVVERCDDEFTPVQDLQDLEVPAPIIKDTTLWWSSSGIKDDGQWESEVDVLLTGQKKLFAPGDLEIGCAYPEDQVLRFPGDLGAECFTVDVFGRELQPGEMYVLNDHFSITFDELQARFTKDSLDESIRYYATWRLDFKKEGVTAIFSAPSTAARGAAADGSLTLKNAFPFPVTVTTNVKMTAESVDEETFDTFETFIDQQATKTVPLETTFLGPHEVIVSNVLQTSVGPVMLLQTSPLAYDVVGQGEVSSATTVTSSSQPWYARFWAWLKEVFSL